jgi:prevent-host-death family protein
MYARGVDVAISALRAGLASWIERARAGEEVIVTDRGIPVARLLAVDSAPLLDRLTQQGVISKIRRRSVDSRRGGPSYYRAHTRPSVTAPVLAKEKLRLCPATHGI